ncbi:MAG: F0F1 ATP synthase subunit delta [Candidatus Ancillula sp.]|jgi:F-type H+-transporting ATPase subunit delta|nr:F0F1 ATP synthase subunit delta [Candidatus Ancillula sp.]
MTHLSLARTSQDSISLVGQKFSSAIQTLSSDINFKCAEDFFELVFTLEVYPLLAKKLTDPNRSTIDKQTLAKRIVKNLKPEKITIDIFSELVANKWSRPKDLQIAIGEFCFTSCIISVHSRNGEPKDTNPTKQLERIEQELFELVVNLKDLSKVDSNIVRLREILSSSNQPLESRIAIIDQLFGDKSKIGIKLDSVTILLAKYATAMLDGEKYLLSLQRIIKKMARTRSTQIVDAVVAVKPSLVQINRLEKLCKEKYKKDIQLNIIIDETVLGGLKISVEDEVFDLTLLNTFNKFKSDFDMEFKV